MRSTLAGAAAELETRRGAVGEQFTRLAGTFRELRCIGSQRLLRAGVSMTHLHVLTMLRHHGPMPMRRIAEILDGSLSNATGIVDRLEERGLVTRERVPDDRRLVVVHLTAAAESLLEDAEVLRHDLLRAVLARLDAEQLDRAARTIGDLADALAAELASAPERDPRVEATGAHGHLHALPERDAVPTT